MNSHRFGRSSEKLEMANRIRFMEIDGTIVYFNEAEAVVESAVENTDEAAVSKPHSKEYSRSKKPGLPGTRDWTIRAVAEAHQNPVAADEEEKREE